MYSQRFKIHKISKMKTKILFLALLTILFSCQKTEIKVFGEQTSIVPIPKTINIDPDKRGLILSNSILFFTSSSEINTLLNVFEKDIESISSMDIKFKETTKIKALILVVSLNFISIEEILSISFSNTFRSVLISELLVKNNIEFDNINPLLSGSMLIVLGIGTILVCKLVLYLFLKQLTLTLIKED